jgi:hypothetical protein
MDASVGWREGSMAKLKGSQVSLIVGGAAVVVAAAGFAWWWQLDSAKKAAAEYDSYAQSGPPCATRTPQDLQTNGPPLRHTFEFGDMALAYSSGGADCAWIKGQDGKLAVCKFDSPGSLGVTQKGQSQVLYAPGVGHSAAILVKGGQLSCVTTAKLVVNPS